MTRCERCNWPQDHRAHALPHGRRIDEESGSANGGRVTYTTHAFVPPMTPPTLRRALSPAQDEPAEGDR